MVNFANGINSFSAFIVGTVFAFIATVFINALVSTSLMTPAVETIAFIVKIFVWLVFVIVFPLFMMTSN